MSGTEETHRSPDYGGRTGHAIFHWMIRTFGVGAAYFALAFVIPYYVLLRPAARRSAAHYLRRRFPDRGALLRFLTTFLYFYRYGQVLVDQAALGFLGIERFRIAFPAARKLERIVARKRGTILLTSHVGYWQAAMAGIGHLDVPVHFQFRLEEHTEGRHFFDLANGRADLRIVSPDGFMGGMIELTAALRRGEVAAVMGDRAFGARTVFAEFLGGRASFPVTPYHLALATAADIVVFLAFRTGKLAFRVECVHIDNGRPRPDSTGQERIDLVARRYVRCLETRLSGSPYMWFNFFDFWNGEKQTRSS